MHLNLWHYLMKRPSRSLRVRLLQKNEVSSSPPPRHITCLPLPRVFRLLPLLVFNQLLNLHVFRLLPLLGFSQPLKNPRSLLTSRRPVVLLIFRPLQPRLFFRLSLSPLWY